MRRRNVKKEDEKEQRKEDKKRYGQSKEKAKRRVEMNGMTERLKYTRANAAARNQ
jgi:hypothetical protein